MQISRLRLSGFQCFGTEPTIVELDSVTYLLGPNGAGKTAVLVALARLFSPLQAMRDVRPEDFHVPMKAEEPRTTELWIEADIHFPEASDTEKHASVPPFFAHMAIEDSYAPPRVRVRLTATLEADGFVDQRIEYITRVDEHDEPTGRAVMHRADRASIEVHYLPARRDPADHVSYAPTSLLGRTLRAADWSVQRKEFKDSAEAITASLAGNDAIKTVGAALTASWSALHTGKFFESPAVSFGHDDIDGVLRQLSLRFSPAHGSEPLDFDRLSDGQKSLLYISLVVAWQSVIRGALAGKDVSLDLTVLRPPVHVLVALEEPENSLSPQYLGRIARLVRNASKAGDLQAVIATHSPAMLKRVDPTSIRFLRLDAARVASVRRIELPTAPDDEAKYVREAVRAFPELYFSRLVILGEGDSEQIVLPRVLADHSLAEDDASISVVPLGGRHVNHFWRLLEGLGIPYLTLLDLDSGRYQGGWGRVRYAAKQLNAWKPSFTPECIEALPAWDADSDVPDISGEDGWLDALEKQGVFFSWPVDLDLMMMQACPVAYHVTPAMPSEKDVAAVLGKKHANEDRLPDEVKYLFEDYRKQFLRGSKPASHIAALSQLDDGDLDLPWNLPDPLRRLMDAVRAKLKSLPE